MSHPALPEERASDCQDTSRWGALGTARKDEHGLICALLEVNYVVWRGGGGLNCCTVDSRSEDAHVTCLLFATKFLSHHGLQQQFNVPATASSTCLACPVKEGGGRGGAALWEGVLLVTSP